MNDEGVGIAGWLLADLALVLAIVFLAFTPAAVSNESELAEAMPTPTPAPTVAPPLILDIGCEEDDPGDGSIAVRCDPELLGGEVGAYRWEADGGRALSYAGSDFFAASFGDAGAVRLTVKNVGGEHRAAFPVLPVTVSESNCSDVQTDFRFAQIVLQGVSDESVSWDNIKRGRVREDVIKFRELGEVDDDEWADLAAEAFLREQLEEGRRIALVETFSHARSGSSVALSRKVNDALFAGLRGSGIHILRDADINGAEGDERWKWFGDYLATNSLTIGEVRLNLYFVKPFDDEDCE